VCHGKLSHGLGRGSRRVLDGDAGFFGVLYIDVVNAYATADDELELAALCFVDVVGTDLGLGADDDGVELAQRSAQLIRLIELLDNFVTCFAQLRHSGLVHSIGNENAHDKLSLFSVVMGFLCQTRRDRFAAPYEVAGTLTQSAAVDGERFFVKTRFGKRRNTLCISRFSNRRIGGKDPPSVVGD